MMTINANTKIAAILKQDPAALEAIISISPRFNKLRNPLLRKLMAARTSIGIASKVGGCSVNDFFDKLGPLGFVAEETKAIEKEEVAEIVPSFMNYIGQKNVVELDVRPAIDSGKDPFNMIMGKIKQLKEGEVLKLINSFEPVPLIQILSKQGFESYVESINDNLVNTFFHKTNDPAITDTPGVKNPGDWDEVMRSFEDRVISVDVRHLEMPLPMMTILESLEKLPAGHVLFVYHKRIPVFLLPELADRKLDYRIRENSNGEVHLIIFSQKDAPGIN